MMLIKIIKFILILVQYFLNLFAKLYLSYGIKNTLLETNFFLELDLIVQTLFNLNLGYINTFLEKRKIFFDEWSYKKDNPHPFPRSIEAIKSQALLRGSYEM